MLKQHGLSPIYNELIEVSAIKYSGEEEVDVFTTLIKPKNKIPENIIKITGITNEMVGKSPNIEEVMPKLIDFIGECDIVAHNARFDFGFLQKNSNNSFSKNKVIDTVALARKMYPKLSNYKLGTVAKYIGIMEDGFHRAEFDCKCCAKIYINYLKLG